MDFPFPDHHAPPLTFLFTIVNAVDSWVEASPENVAIVHCKGGKGRTGVVIVCWLMYSALFPDIGDAAKHFAAKRSATAKGVTQPSQVRYLTYFSNTLLLGHRPPCQRYRLVSVFFGPVPKQYATSFSVQVLAYHGDTSDELFSADSTRADIVGVSTTGENYYQVLVGVSVVDDVLIRFFEAHKKTGPPKKLFHIVFHTGFLNTADHDICFKFRDLDNPSKKVPRTFTFSCQMERRADTLGDQGAGSDPFIQRMCQTFQKRIRKKCGAPLGSHRGGLELVSPERAASPSAAGTPAAAAAAPPSPTSVGLCSTSSSTSTAPGHWAGGSDALGRGESPGNDTSTMLSRILADDGGGGADEGGGGCSSSSITVGGDAPSPLDAVSMSTAEFSPPTAHLGVAVPQPGAHSPPAPPPALLLSTSLPAQQPHFSPLVPCRAAPRASQAPLTLSEIGATPLVLEEPAPARATVLPNTGVRGEPLALAFATPSPPLQQQQQWQQAPTFQRANHRITFSPPLQRTTTIGQIRAHNALALRPQPCVRIGERAGAAAAASAQPQASPSPLPHSVPLQLPPEASRAETGSPIQPVQVPFPPLG